MMHDKHWLSRLEVRQMAGRAGRSGFDTTGEAILIVGSKYTRQADKISKLIEVRGSICSHIATCMARQIFSIQLPSKPSLWERTLSASDMRRMGMMWSAAA